MHRSNKKMLMSLLVALLVLGFAFSKSGLVGVNDYALLQKDLEEFKNTDKQLNYDVLNVRIGKVRHYNNIDVHIHRLYKLLESIEANSKKLQLDSTKLLKDVKSQLVQKEDAVNHLKSDNGVLRNSLMYFSALSEELFTQYSDGNGATDDPYFRSLVLKDLPVLNNRILQVIRNPSDSILLDYSLLLKDKKNAFAKIKFKDLRSRVYLLVRHAEIVVEHTREVNEAVEHILDPVMPGLVNTMLSQISQNQAQAEQSSLKYKLVLFVSSVMLLFYASFVFYRLTFIARELKSNLIELRYQKMAVDKHAVVCVIDKTGRIKEVNQNYTEVFSRDASEVLNKNMAEIHNLISVNGEDIYQKVKSGDAWNGELSDKTSNGMQVWFELTVVPFLDEQKNVYQTIFIGTNITDRKEAEKHIEYQAYHDALTGLPNRHLIMDRLEQSLIHCRQNNRYGGLIHIGLDRFKRINDTFGHQAGDWVLMTVASRLTTALADVTVGRMSNDEFVILLTDTAGSVDQSRMLIQRVISEVQTVLAQKHIFNETDIFVAPSIGITLFPMGKESPQEIMKQADTALARAKESGAGSYRFYHPKMQDMVESGMMLESDMRKAISNSGFHLNFQPQYHISGTMKGAEVLIRWHHAEKGNISPATFIPLAEETGLIIEIGNWVLETVCGLIARWSDHFQEKLPFRHLAVNVSAHQFLQSDFVDTIKYILNKTGADPSRLELEITEGMLITDVSSTIAKIIELKELGIRFSVDDFGTGYSSLSYLTKLPIEQLKIDQGFVRNIENDKYKGAIVETIISMARHLDMEVIAEGVETEAEQRYLKDKGCFNYQGYYYSKPMAEQDFFDLLSGIAENHQEKQIN